MLWLTYIFLIIAGYAIKKSNIYDIIVVFLFSLLALLNHDAADYELIYLPVYLNPDANIYSSIEVGWIILCQIGNNLRLSYNGFSFIIVFITMSIVLYFAHRLTNNTSRFLSLFLVYPGLISLIQIRQFVASAIVLLAVLIITKDDVNLVDYFKFIIILLFGFLIHKTSVFMLIFILAKLIISQDTEDKKIIFIIAIIIYSALLINAQRIGTYIFGDFKTKAYLQQIGEIEGNIDDPESLFGGIRNAIALVLLSATTYFSSKLLISYENIDTNNQYYKIINCLSVLMLAIIPFLFITKSFMRLILYLYIPIIIVFINAIERQDTSNLFSSELTILIIHLFIAIEFLIRGAFSNVIVPLLTFNYIPFFFIQ